jgi:hypothetical protein
LPDSLYATILKKKEAQPEEKKMREQNISQVRDNEITENLNRVYETESSSIDPVLMKMQIASMENVEKGIRLILEL